MQLILSDTQYVFDPLAGTVTFQNLGFSGFEIENIVRILNVEEGKRRVLYSAENETPQGFKHGGTLAGLVLTLEVNTSGLGAGDDLQINIILTESQAVNLFGTGDEMNFVQYLDEVGDGTGNADAIQDYSGGATSFKRQHVAGEKPINIGRLVVYYGFTGNPRVDRYGSSLVLTNGIIIRKTDSAGGVIVDYTEQFKIFINGDWARQGAVFAFSDQGAGDNFGTATINYKGISGFITLKDEEIFEVILEDDFTSFVEQKFMIKGNQNS